SLHSFPTRRSSDLRGQSHFGMFRHRGYDMDSIHILPFWNILIIGKAKVFVQVEFCGQLVQSVLVSCTDAHRFDIWMALIDGNKFFSESHPDYNNRNFLFTHVIIVFWLIFFYDFRITKYELEMRSTFIVTPIFLTSDIRLLTSDPKSNVYSETHFTAFLSNA